jgi:hypothetical protein
MKRLLLILLLLAAAAAHGQIDNPPTSVNILDATTVGRAVLTASNAAAARSAIEVTLTNLSSTPTLTALTNTGNSVLGTNSTNTVTVGGNLLVGGSIAVTNAATTRTNLGGTTVGNAVFTATNAAAAAASIGLGATNDVQFNKALSQSTVIGGGVDAFLHVVTQQQGEIQIGWGSGDSEYDELALTLEQSDWKFYKPFSVPNATNRAIIRTNLGLGLPALTNTSNVTTMRALAGSTNTNQPFSGSIALTNTNTLVFSNGILLSQ